MTKRFRLESGRRITAVDDVSLEIPRGQLICVLGPSGHGKSTLLNLIAGFVTPSSGEVLVDGRPVRGPGPDRGVIFQRDTVFLWRRVAENIGFGLRARKVPRVEREAIVARYLEVTGLTDYATAWPRQLSGGMRRRVAIATVFANDPAVLLMDEPFVGLDYWRRAALHDVLLDLWSRSQRTVFFITHDIDEALTLADRIIVIVEASVALDIDVELPRPRPPELLASDAAGALRLQILSRITPQTANA